MRRTNPIAMIMTSIRTLCLSRTEYARPIARYMPRIARQAVGRRRVVAIAAAAIATDAAIAGPAGTSPDAIGRDRFFGFAASDRRSQTSLIR